MTLFDSLIRYRSSCQFLVAFLGTGASAQAAFLKALKENSGTADICECLLENGFQFCKKCENELYGAFTQFANFKWPCNTMNWWQQQTNEQIKKKKKDLVLPNPKGNVGFKSADVSL